MATFTEFIDNQDISNRMSIAYCFQSIEMKGNSWPIRFKDFFIDKIKTFDNLDKVYSSCLKIQSFIAGVNPEISNQISII